MSNLYNFYTHLKVIFAISLLRQPERIAKFRQLKLIRFAQFSFIRFAQFSFIQFAQFSFKLYRLPKKEISVFLHKERIYSSNKSGNVALFQGGAAQAILIHFPIANYPNFPNNSIDFHSIMHLSDAARQDCRTKDKCQQSVQICTGHAIIFKFLLP